MDIRKLVLYFALALVGVSLWNAWMRDYPPESVKKAQLTSQTIQQPNVSAKPGEFTPAPYTPSPMTSTPTAAPAATNAPAAVFKVQPGSVIHVKTDLLDAAINLTGGNITSAKLPQYAATLTEKNTPVQILNDNPSELYIVQSGLTNSTDKSLQNIQFTSPQTNYVLSAGENELTITLKGRTDNGLEVKKTFTFQRGLYSIKTNINVKNASSNPWSGSIFHQIIRKNIPPQSGFRAQSYNEAAISSPEEPYQKLTYKTLESGINREIREGWIAMQQQYFLTAWIPSDKQMNHYYSHFNYDTESAGKHNVYTIGFVSPQFTLTSGDEKSAAAVFYVGPELANQLKPLAKGLDLTIDYGWLWPISKLLFWIMDKIHNVVANWGWSIILVTLLIKIIFYPFSDKSYKSMVKMRDLQPKLQALKDRYADDKQALSKAMMELYRTEKVNPMGGCLPMIIQIPVFIALYYVLIESVELRHAPFMLWIQDLSSKDPYYVLPILMGISMFVQQKLSPPPPDPTQAKMMMLLPVVFTVFLISFPSGLVLYWLTNNILSILQQWYVMKTYRPHLKTKVKTKKKKIPQSKKQGTLSEKAE